jgi:hypothetical protein
MSIQSPSARIHVPAIAGSADARPLLHRTHHNSITRAEHVRDELEAQLRELVQSEGMDVHIVKSPPFSSSVWVSFESWVQLKPDGLTTGRGRVSITVRPADFHHYEQVFDIEVNAHGRRRKYTSLAELSAGHLSTLVQHALGRGSLMGFFPSRLRESWWQFWRPRNALVGFKHDWVPGVGRAAMAVGAAAMIGGQFTVGLLLVVAGVLGPKWHRRTPCHTLSAGRPPQEPRNLIRLDSWQALIGGLGALADPVKAAVRADLERIRPQGFAVGVEQIPYWGVDGLESREQMVVRFRRAIAFIHVYCYGEDLYVGWDAHVNSGTWVEKIIAEGLEPGTSQRVEVRTVTGGWHIPCEYDVSDADCLIEWVHNAVTRVARRFMEEQRIDQEIDFKIVREGRRDVVGRRDASAGEAARAVTGRFQKVLDRLS